MIDTAAGLYLKLKYKYFCKFKIFLCKQNINIIFIGQKYVRTPKNIYTPGVLIQEVERVHVQLLVGDLSLLVEAGGGGGGGAAPAAARVKHSAPRRPASDQS